MVHGLLTVVASLVKHKALGRLSFCSCSAWTQQMLLSGARAGSVVVVQGYSCLKALGIFPILGLNLCPLHWQADS